MKIIETATWRIMQENHDEFAEIAIHGPNGDDATGLAWQAAHPEAIYYSKTRNFCRKIEGTNEEEWIFIDEYDSLEDYEKSHETLYSDPAYEEMKREGYKHTMSLMVPGSNPEHSVWEEVPGTNMEFKEHKLTHWS